MGERSYRDVVGTYTFYNFLLHKSFDSFEELITYFSDCTSFKLIYNAYLNRFLLFQSMFTYQQAWSEPGDEEWSAVSKAVTSSLGVTAVTACGLTANAQGAVPSSQMCTRKSQYNAVNMSE